MELRDWLTQNEISDDAMADRLGISRQSLWRYRSGKRLPDKDMLNRIFEATGGAVTANDFVHAAPSQSETAA